MEDRDPSPEKRSVAPVGGVGGHHARVLHAAAVAVDRLLGDIESVIGSPDSPVRRTRDDLPPAQKQVLSALVRSIHARMSSALDQLGVPPARPSGSARAAVGTALTFIEIALQEAAPARLRGYGALSVETAAAIEAMLADVARAVDEARDFLAAPARADLAARIAKLARSAEREELARIEDAVRQLGLVALRRPLEALVEQLESGTYEIAFFGRVSSGKSSLVNAIVERPVLPVGALPVTSVPTRLVWSAQASVIVRRAEGGADEQRLAIDQVADLVTEERNPGNAKGVLRVTVALPAARLVTNVALVDTPGLSALASAGARETFAYMPRCDLGVVVIDGSSGVEGADLDVVRTLRDSGIEVEIVLSKADRLSAGDRSALAGYVGAQLTARLGIRGSPRWVSAVDEGGSLARAWFDDVLGPRVAQARERADRSTKRKLAALEELIKRAEASPAASDDTTLAVERIAAEAARLLELRRRACDDAVAETRTATLDVLRAAAAALHCERNRNAGEVLATALREHASRIRESTRGALLDTRDRLRGWVEDAGRLRSARVDADVLQVDLTAMPEIQVPETVATASCAPPRFPGLQRREQRMAEKLADVCGAAVESSLRSFAKDLEGWARLTLARLGEQLDSQLEPLRADGARAIELSRRLANEGNEL